MLIFFQNCIELRRKDFLRIGFTFPLVSVVLCRCFKALSWKVRFIKKNHFYEDTVFRLQVVPLMFDHFYKYFFVVFKNKSFFLLFQSM